MDESTDLALYLFIDNVVMVMSISVIGDHPTRNNTDDKLFLLTSMLVSLSGPS